MDNSAPTSTAATASATSHPVGTPTPAGSGVSGWVDHFLTHPPHVSDLELAGGAVAAAGLIYGGAWAVTRRQSKDGFANRRQLRPMTARGIFRDVRRQWPSLAERRRRDLPVSAYAAELGKCVAPRTRAYISHKDVALVVGPAQSGKTGLLAVWAMKAPGAAVVTSTKIDLYRMLKDYREQFGRTHLFNPEGDGGLPSTFRWSPVTGSESPMVAMQNAAAIVAGGGDGDDMTNAAYWQDKATEVLAAYLHAAALSGSTFRTVWAWSTNRSDETAWHILSNHERAADGWDEILYAAQQGGDQRHTSNVYSTLTRSLRFMANPGLAEITMPDEAHPEIDLDAFIASHDTIFMVGENRAGLSIAPLFLAFVTALHARAKRVSTFQRMERLDPPLTFVIDEAALICPIPLDEWAADSGGRGIAVRVAFQAMSQIDNRYGVLSGRTVRGASNVTVLLGGNTDAEYLEQVSRLCGTHTEMIPVPDRNGPDRKVPQTVPNVTPDMVRHLPMYRALVLYRNVPVTMVDYTPLWEHRDLKRFHREQRRAARRAAREASAQQAAADAAPARDAAA